MLMGLNLGTFLLQNSITSAVSFKEGLGGNMYVPLARYSFIMSFCRVPLSFCMGSPCFSPAAIYIARITRVGALMVKEVVILSRGMSSKSISIS